MGTVPHRPDHVRKLVEKLAAGGGRLQFCCEVGPCGYALHRQLVEMGHECIVVAPSLIPLKTGDRLGRNTVGNPRLLLCAGYADARSLERGRA